MTDLTKPARGYTWEPFKPGNTVRLSHGAHSERIFTELAAHIANEAVEHLPYLQNPSYRTAIRAWALVAARAELLERYIDEHGQLDDAGEVRPAATLLAKLTTQESNLSKQLGLDPLSRAKLGKDIASTQVDMAEWLAAQREAAEGKAT